MSFLDYTRKIADIRLKESKNTNQANHGAENVKTMKFINLHYLEPIKEAKNVLED